MKIAEKIMVGIVILALVLKLLQIPGASALLIVLIGALSLFYMTCSFVIFKSADNAINVAGTSSENSSGFRTFGSIATGISLLAWSAS